MRVIGLTGGIGTGKSTVSQFLSELGAVIIDADAVGHEALMPDSSIHDKVVAAFGQEILASDGTIDRKKLARIVFDSPDNLTKLNNIVHPWMYETMKAKIEGYRKDGVKVVVLDAAILIEANWVLLVDEVWATVASQDTVIARLKKRGEGLSEADAFARIRNQMPTEERVKHAAVVIDTDCSLDEVRVKVAKLWQEVLRQV